jgi:hypothetical protein
VPSDGERTPTAALPDEPSQESPQEPPTRIEKAQAELALQIDASLDGFLYVNDLLDQVLVLAALPVEDHIDMNYEANDEFAYRIKDTPPGTTAHFLVGMESFVRNGVEFRPLQLEIQMGAGASALERNAMREGPRIHLVLDHNEEGVLGHFAFVTERKVELYESRRLGIDAYRGRFTSGATYGVDLNDPLNQKSETYGLIDAAYATGDMFGGISPLVGDMQLDLSRVAALQQLLVKHFETIKDKQR